MKANNLSICVPHGKQECRLCPYCVSRMTGMYCENIDLMRQNMPKVATLARATGVTSVMITGKTEPMDSIELWGELIHVFSDFPMEIQTNSRWWHNGTHGMEELHLLKKIGVNIVAMSADDRSGIDTVCRISAIAEETGLVVRATLNVSDRLFPTHSVRTEDVGEIIELLSCGFVRQCTFRKLSYPSSAADTPEAEWIQNHNCKSLFGQVMAAQKNYIEKQGGRLVRRLPDLGVSISDIGRMSIATSDYCIQEAPADDNIRSLIFANDGHVYTSWDSSGTLLI